MNDPRDARAIFGGEAARHSGLRGDARFPDSASDDPRSRDSVAGESSGRTIGPYTIGEVLGEGGMSVVYRAKSPQSGDVALKTVRTPNTACFEGLRREIRALRRLRHPGIVRIVDDGVHEGSPYVVMDLLEGTTLEGTHRSLFPSLAALRSSTVEPDYPPKSDRSPPQSERNLPSTLRDAAGGELPRVFDILRRILSPLAFLHGEGLLHGDLKPQNVFLLGDGAPDRRCEPRSGLFADEVVLVDFGLADWVLGRLGRASADVVTRFVGTPHYMAPERIRREALDARSDLYAFGCLAYEMLTGRPPFLGTDVLVRHLSTPAKPPSAYVHGIPEELDALILSLLEKDRRKRPGNIESIAERLEALGAAKDPRWTSFPPRKVVYAPSLVGRAEDQRVLREHAERARVGMGSLLVVRGESGLGKTSLVTDFARRSCDLMQVVVARAEDRKSGRGAFRTLARLFEFVADTATLASPAQRERLFPPEVTPLLELEAELTRFSRIPDRGRSPEVFDRGRSPEVFDRGRSPEVFDRGRSPEVFDRGRSPEVFDGGRSPEVFDGGRSPEVFDGGRSPEVLDGGRSPEVLDGGRSPEVLDGGRSPEVLDGGRSPEVLDGGRSRYAANPWPHGVPESGIRARQEHRSEPRGESARAGNESQVARDREELLVAMRELLFGLAREAPLALIVEDVQWADELTLRLLLNLTELTTESLLIICTLRSEEAQGEVLDLLSRPHVITHSLSRLGQEAMREMVEEMLGTATLPEGFVAGLGALTAGNPLFVAESLRQHSAQSRNARLAQPEPNTPAPLDPLPHSVREVVAQRLHSLGEKHAWSVQAASVLERRFDLELLSEITKRPTSDVLDAIAELVAREMVTVEADGAGESFRFAHEMLREVAESSLSKAEASCLHSRVLHCLSQRHAEPERLLHHATCAGQFALARQYALEAAERALNGARYRDAVNYANQGLSFDDTRESGAARSGSAGELLLAKARALFLDGAVEQASEQALASLRALGHAGPERRGQLPGCLVAGLLRQVASRFLPHKAVSPDAAAAARAATLLVHRYFYEDDALAMLATAVFAVNLAEKGGAERLVPRPYSFLGFLAGAARLRSLSASYFERARSGARLMGDARELAFVWNAEAIDHLGQGRLFASEMSVRGGRAAAFSTRDGESHALTLTTAGHVAFYRGQLAASEAAFEALGKLAESRQHVQHLTWSLFSRARALLFEGCVPEALELLEAAHGRLAERRELQSEIITAGLLAAGYLSLGEKQKARHAAGLAAELIASSRPTSFAVAEGYLASIEVFVALGELQQADRLVTALSRLAFSFPLVSIHACLARAQLCFARQRLSAGRAAAQKALLLSTAFGAEGFEGRIRDLVESGAGTYHRATHGRISSRP